MKLSKKKGVSYYTTIIEGFTWIIDGTTGKWEVYFINHFPHIKGTIRRWDATFSKFKDARKHLIKREEFLKERSLSKAA